MQSMRNLENAAKTTLIEGIIPAFETKHWWLYWVLAIGWILLASNMLVSMLASVVFFSNMEAGLYANYNISTQSVNTMLIAGITAMNILTYFLIGATIFVIFVTFVGIRYYYYHREPARSLMHRVARWVLFILTLVPVGLLLWMVTLNPGMNFFNLIEVSLFIMVYLIGKGLAIVGLGPLIP